MTAFHVPAHRLERSPGPSGTIAIGRLAHDQQPTIAEESSSTLGNHRRNGERARDHDVERSVVDRLPGQFLRTPPENPHPIGQFRLDDTETFDGLLEEAGATSGRIDEHDRQISSRRCQR